MNFKSVLPFNIQIVCYFVNKEKYWQICTFHFNCLCSLLQWNWKEPMIKFYFISIVWVHFSHKTEKFRFWKSLKYINIFGWKRYVVRFEYVPWKNVWFCFISIAWVHFSHKTEEFWFWLSKSVWFGLRWLVWLI